MIVHKECQWFGRVFAKVGEALKKAAVVLQFLELEQ